MHYNNSITGNTLAPEKFAIRATATPPHPDPATVWKVAQALAEITGGQLPTASIGFADALARCWPGAGLTERHFDRVGTRARDWRCGQHRVELRSR